MRDVIPLTQPWRGRDAEVEAVNFYSPAEPAPPESTLVLGRVERMLTLLGNYSHCRDGKIRGERWGRKDVEPTERK